MRPLRAPRVALAVACAATLGPLTARAFAAPGGAGQSVVEDRREDRGLTTEERGRLAQGESVVFEQTVENDRARYVGGVTYTLLAASADEIADLFEDPRAWRAVLPMTKSARLVAPPVAAGKGAPSAARDFWVELRQGNGLVDAVYTLRVRPSDDRRSYRFWLDARMTHDIADAWGFFRVEPAGTGPATAGEASPRVLLTFGVLVDVGDGLVRVFEERVRPVLLGVPLLVRGYVATRYRHAKKT